MQLLFQPQMTEVSSKSFQKWVVLIFEISTPSSSSSFFLSSLFLVLAHTRQVLYHWATSQPYPKFLKWITKLFWPLVFVKVRFQSGERTSLWVVLQGIDLCNFGASWAPVPITALLRYHSHTVHEFKVFSSVDYIIQLSSGSTRHWFQSKIHHR
jgi:hypothetical protein